MQLLISSNFVGVVVVAVRIIDALSNRFRNNFSFRISVQHFLRFSLCIFAIFVPISIDLLIVCVCVRVCVCMGVYVRDL